MKYANINNTRSSAVAEKPRDSLYYLDISLGIKSLKFSQILSMFKHIII